MVSNSPDWFDEEPEVTSWAPIDEKGRQIIVLLWRKWILSWKEGATPFINLRSLSIRLIDIAQVWTVIHLANNQNNTPKSEVLMEIQDNSNPQEPLLYSFLNNASLGRNPYYNTINLLKNSRIAAAWPEQYMPVLVRAIDELTQSRDTDTEQR